MKEGLDLKIAQMVKSICKTEKTKTGEFFHKGSYVYRVTYEGQRWIDAKKDLLRPDNFICNIRVDYKGEGDHLYNTYCRIQVKILNNVGLNHKKLINILIDAFNEELIKYPEIYNDFF